MPVLLQGMGPIYFGSQQDGPIVRLIGSSSPDPNERYELMHTGPRTASPFHPPEYR